MKRLFLFFVFLTTFSAQAFDCDEERINLLLEQEDWPSYSDIIAIVGGVPSTSCSVIKKYVPKAKHQILQSAKIIVDLEAMNPGAFWAPLGRDSRRVGDVLEAYALKIGQGNRVVRLNASGGSFRRSADYQHLMESVGLVSNKGVPLFPFTILDSTNWNTTSQSYRLLQESLRGIDKNDVRDSHRKANVLAIRAMGGNAEVLEDRHHVERYFKQVKFRRNVPETLLKTDESLAYLEGETCWHQSYGCLKGKDGEWKAKLGCQSSKSEKKRILAMMALTYEVVHSNEFEKKLKEFEEKAKISLQDAASSFVGETYQEEIIDDPEQFLEELIEARETNVFVRFPGQNSRLFSLKRHYHEWSQDLKLRALVQKAALEFDFVDLVLGNLQTLDQWVLFLSEVRSIVNDLDTKLDRTGLKAKIANRSELFLSFNPPNDVLDSFLEVVSGKVPASFLDFVYKRKFSNKINRLSELRDRVEFILGYYPKSKQEGRILKVIKATKMKGPKIDEWIDFLSKMTSDVEMAKLEKYFVSRFLDEVRTKKDFILVVQKLRTAGIAESSISENALKFVESKSNWTSKEIATIFSLISTADFQKKVVWHDLETLRKNYHSLRDLILMIEARKKLMPAVYKDDSRRSDRHFRSLVEVVVKERASIEDLNTFSSYFLNESSHHVLYRAFLNARPSEEELEKFVKPAFLSASDKSAFEKYAAAKKRAKMKRRLFQFFGKDLEPWQYEAKESSNDHLEILTPETKQSDSSIDMKRIQKVRKSKASRKSKRAV